MERASRALCCFRSVAVTRTVWESRYEQINRALTVRARVGRHREALGFQHNFGMKRRVNQPMGWSYLKAAARFQCIAPCSLGQLRALLVAVCIMSRSQSRIICRQPSTCITTPPHSYILGRRQFRPFFCCTHTHPISIPALNFCFFIRPHCITLRIFTFFRLRASPSPLCVQIPR